MSIAARCRCGKKFQVKNSAAGKKFKCTDCGEVVKVPEEQLDDLEDFDEDEADDFDDGEIKMPVRRKKKKSSKAMNMAKGIAWEAAKDAPALIVRIVGIPIGILGAYFGVLGFVIAGGGLLTGQFALFFAGGFTGVVCFLGVRAAFGLGLKVSREFIWHGTGSILGGILIIGFGMICYVATAQFAIRFFLQARPVMRQPDFRPPGNFR